jgi:hypothetical protein
MARYWVKFKRIKKTNRVMASLVMPTNAGPKVMAQKSFHAYQTSYGTIDPNVQKWASPLVNMYRLLSPHG